MGLSKKQDRASDNFLNLSESGLIMSGARFFKFVAMNIKLTKPLIFFDLETTGLSLTKDRICQISFTKFFPQLKGEKSIDPVVKTRILNPQITIPQEAIDVHGITNEVAKKAVLFEAVASSLSGFFEGCDLAGYNCMRFDVPMLREHFLRCDINFPDPKACIVDVFKIVQEIIPRNLSAMFKLITGTEPEEAHNAEYDNMMCIEVLTALMKPKALIKIDPGSTMKGVDTVEDLHDLSASNEEMVDYAGKVIVNPRTGEYEWNFGKHRGERVLDHRPYALWILSGDFTEDTKTHLMSIYKRAKLKLQD